MNNFEFLKNIDKNLYNIISDAENLYRDEYFEQSISQTRRFAENVCKNVLGDSRTCERTFDDMLATLKDKTKNSEQEKEFIDDLYFIKREGNNSVHASKVKQDGMIALECLQRAFEVSLNYAVYYCKAKSNLLKLRYDTELLITGKKSKQSLAEKYQEQKAKTRNTSTKKHQKQTKQYSIHKNKNKPSNNKVFWGFVGFASIISIILVLTIFLLSLA